MRFFMLCLISQLLDLSVVRILTAKRAKISPSLVYIALIPWMRVLIRLARLKVLARMFCSSTGLLTMFVSVIIFVPSITSMALV